MSLNKCVSIDVSPTIVGENGEVEEDDDPTEAIVIERKEKAQALKRSSSKRESAKQRRSSSKRYLTAGLTDKVMELLDSFNNFSHTGTLSRKKRAKSCERDLQRLASAAANINTNPDPSSSTAPPPRPETVVSSAERPNLARRSSDAAVASLSRSISREDSTASALGDMGATAASFEISIEEEQEKYFGKAMSKVRELVETERTYVEKGLREVVDGYYTYMEESKLEPETHVKIPEDLLGGKDKIIFGNIRDIYDFHRDCIYPQIRKCLDDPCLLKSIFETRRDTLKKKYGRFCLNKPKSEYIISQHKDKYFAVLRLKQNYAQSLSTQMMTPIQRVTRYQLLLKEIEKYMGRAGRPEVHADVKRAYEISHEIAEYANNMMIAGRISGFNGDVTSQGLLLKKGHALCYKRKSALKKPKIKSCHFFVFQETIIVCEKPPMQTETGFPQNLEYFASFKMNKLTVREVFKDTFFGFELVRKADASSRGESVRSSTTREDSAPAAIVVQFESEPERDEWLKTINDQIRDLTDIAKRLENPQFM